MSIPALRQPKQVKPTAIKHSTYVKDEQFVILTLKNGGKLVVSSDTYNAVVTLSDRYKCVVCCVEMQLNNKSKENHKLLASHKRILERFPHKEEFGSNLIRQLNKDTCYCTICNASMPSHTVQYHIAGASHLEAMERASTRANAYLPTDVNNNK